MTTELRNDWDDLAEKVKELRVKGYTVLQIEEETGFDYEDICWAVRHWVLLEALKEIQ